MAESSMTIVGSTGWKTTVSRAFTQADTGATTIAVELPQYAYIPPYGVNLYVAEVFDAASTIDIGDGTDTGGWVNQSDNTSTTTGTYTGTATNSAYSDTGKVYTSADTIDVTLSAGLTVGTCYVIVRWWDLSATDLAAA